MNIRAIEEADIEPVIQLFRANYGDDYALPEFYDPQWVKRGIYSDHIIWLVIEDGGRIVASGACVLNFGDYNDQIGEIGRLVVDPNFGGHGLGREMLTALVDASGQRVEFAFAEARTVHPKTQKIVDGLGMAPLGFLPMYYMMGWRESWVLSGQLFGNGRRLRRIGKAEVIPAVAPLAQLSMKNLELDEPFTARADAPMMIGQVQVLDIVDLDAAREKILAARDEILALANSKISRSQDSGAKDVQVRLFRDTRVGPMLVVHLAIHVRDAMGANAVNTICETVAPLIEQITRGRVVLRILSNLADQRLARASCSRAMSARSSSAVTQECWPMSPP